MNRTKSFLLAVTLLVAGPLTAQRINQDKVRASEIKQLMWGPANKQFLVKEVPEKWSAEDAVIIAKSQSLSYRKGVMSMKVNYDNFHHIRIKLQSAKALEEYATFSVPESATLGGTTFTFYAGFKILKADGKEIEIDVAKTGVVEKMEVNSKKLSILKVAIPNLEKGDIIDYYTAEERDIMLGQKFYTFDPEIFVLNDDHPIIYQTIAFDVLRRCYINLKSLNGAPEFKLTEEAVKEKNHYFMEDTDRASVKDVRWLYPYRELPTVKFKVTYTTDMIANYVPLFLGTPGVLKEEVTKSELSKYVEFVFSETNNASSWSTAQPVLKELPKLIKDRNKLAREAYYRLRYLVPENVTSGYRFGHMAVFSRFCRANRIPHEVIVGIPRSISEIKHLAMEDELTYMIYVKTSQPFYVSNFNRNAIPGDLETALQGQEVYFADGLLPVTAWSLAKRTLPVLPAEENTVVSDLSLSLTDLDNGTFAVKETKSYTGASREPFQNALINGFDFYNEELEKYESPKSLAKLKKSSSYKDTMKKYAEYKESKQAKLDERLLSQIKQDFEGLEVEKVENSTIEQMGRYDDQPVFKIRFDVTGSGAVKKAGPNYLVDIGKFIEGQAHIEEEERKRKYNVYMPFARTFRYNLTFDIPEGYEVQGIENLNVSTENPTGGFASAATIKDGKLHIQTVKFYASNFEKSENWPQLVAFLDAAYDFTQKQILLRKI